VARLAGAQPAHPNSSPRLGSGAQEFFLYKKIPTCASVWIGLIFLVMHVIFGQNQIKIKMANHIEKHIIIHNIKWI
jgi:hypothetical protein